MTVKSIAETHGMDVDFVQWFFDNKKDGAGNVWFIVLAAMWEARDYYKKREAELRAQGVEMLVKTCKENVWCEDDVNFMLCYAKQPREAKA
ncbi:hypothetical protein A9797_12210 [Edwardsiella piscicida]|uniref:hypothetical protein n=1 Tax=Edwardsiella piscicida TaxID=1263550 RepID=UPI001CED8C49|nr:hypothetical protein [Edwardsiella piscicida]AOP43693.2 hypothetical protein A9797_11955 [Edwardsiella piscicida]AOP43739.2 hypothetical protein A9797_12210 [Edwardsiella piscicida]